MWTQPLHTTAKVWNVEMYTGAVPPKTTRQTDKFNQPKSPTMSSAWSDVGVSDLTNFQQLCKSVSTQHWVTHTCHHTVAGVISHKGIVVPRSFCFRAITAQTKKSIFHPSAIVLLYFQWLRRKIKRKEKKIKVLQPPTSQWFIAVGSRETVPPSGALIELLLGTCTNQQIWLVYAVHWCRTRLCRRQISCNLPN